MSHLGDRVSALVDGRLTVDAAERALVHLAGCETCRREVAAERSVRRLLAADREPAPPPDLTASLLAMGGVGPLPPRHDGARLGGFPDPSDARPGGPLHGLTGAGLPGAGLPGAGLPGAGLPGADQSGGGSRSEGRPGTAPPPAPGPLPARLSWQPPASGAPGSDPAGMPGAGMPGAGVPGAGMPGAGMPGAGMPSVPAAGAAWPAPGPDGAGARRMLAVAGGSAAVLATGVLGVGLLGAQVPAQPSASVLRPGPLAVSLPPAAEARAVTASQQRGAPAVTGDVVAAEGWWDHVVRGTRVLAVLVTGS